LSSRNGICFTVLFQSGFYCAATIKSVDMSGVIRHSKPCYWWR